MTLITYKPSRSSILSDIDMWMENFWGFGDTIASNSNLSPDFNISQNNDSYFISSDLPGIDKKDVEVTVSDDSIVIKGERKSTDQDTNDYLRYNSMRFGSFEKSFYIPDDANPQKINASMENGVLTVEIKKAKKVAKNIKKIAIK